MIKNLPLRWKLFLPVMAFLAVGFLILHFVSYRYSNEYIIKKTYEALEDESHKTTDILLSEIARASTELELMKSLITDLANNRIFNRKEYEKQFYVWAENNSFLKGTWIDWVPGQFDKEESSLGRFNFFWARDAKNKIVMQAPYKWEDVKDMPYFYEPMHAKEQVIVEPYLDTLNGGREFVASMSAPIINKNGTFLGVVGCDFGMDHIQKMLEKTRPYGTGITRLVTDELIIVGDINRENISKEWPEKIEFNVLRSKMLLGSSFYLTSYEPSLKEDAIKYFRPVKIGLTQKVWYFVSIIPLTSVHKEANTLFYIYSGTLFLIYLLLGLLIWVLICEIERKLSNFSHLALGSAKSLNEMSDMLSETKINLNQMEKMQLSLRSTSNEAISEVDKNIKNNLITNKESMLVLEECKKINRESERTINDALYSFLRIKNCKDPLISKDYYEAIEEGVEATKKCKMLLLQMNEEILKSDSKNEEIRLIMNLQEKEMQQLKIIFENIENMSLKHHDLNQKVAESALELNRKAKFLTAQIVVLNQTITGSQEN